MPVNDLASHHFDLIIIGEGLSGSLLALRLAALKPGFKTLLIDAKNTCDNKTWSFYSSDLSPGLLQWIDPWIEKSWPYQYVYFNDFSRRLNGSYHSIRSERLQLALEETNFVFTLRGQIARPLNHNQVQLQNGSAVTAQCVVDARGWQPLESQSKVMGYQKFVGLDVELESPHALDGPTVMDATVEQQGDFRFFYLLPWTHSKLLIEDTRYSMQSQIDVPSTEAAILEYAALKNWKIRSIHRKEKGCLPIPLDDFKFEGSTHFDAIPCIGVRAGLFHSTTSYSFPFALHTADLLANLPDFNANSIKLTVSRLSQSLRSQQLFYQRLNRMLMLACEPNQRARVLSRFYQLPPNLISRFYAGQTNWSDRLRILLGKPPVPLMRALSVWNPSELQQ